MEPETLLNLKIELNTLANEYMVIDHEQAERMRRIEELRQIIHEQEVPNPEPLLG